MLSNTTMATAMTTTTFTASSSPTTGDTCFSNYFSNNLTESNHAGLIETLQNCTPEELAEISRLFDNSYALELYIQHAFVIFAYSVIFIISLVGNVMVCYIIINNRKLHTVTNCFIVNLSASDILMTVINIPFNVMRILMEDWPFGLFMCRFVPFIQAASVYVSTLSMCFISIDRYFAVVYPFSFRINGAAPFALVLILIWLLSAFLAIPFVYYNEITEIKLVRNVVRCRAVYPFESYHKWMTALSFFTQNFIPLMVATIAYLSIAFHIKQRSKLGVITPDQIKKIIRINRQTIKLLMIVLIVFVICWFPMHCYYFYHDFIDPSYTNMNLYLCLLWLAMSSTCYNPFIYSVRNKHFRNGMKSLFRCVLFKNRSVDSNGLAHLDLTKLTIAQSIKSNSIQTGDSCLVNDQFV